MLEVAENSYKGHISGDFWIMTPKMLFRIILNFSPRTSLRKCVSLYEIFVGLRVSMSPEFQGVNRGKFVKEK
jgi:hypothetical protein